MELLSLNIGANSLEVTPNWKFSRTCCLIITDSHGMESCFGKVNTALKGSVSTNGELTCGFLKSDGTLVRDKCKARNSDSFTLLISAVGGMIDLSSIDKRRIKVSPILKKDGSMSAAIIYLLKNQRVDIKVDGQYPKTVHLEYSQYDQRLHANYSVTIKQSWWKRFFRSIYLVNTEPG